jgi:hypothetical protein
MPNENRNVKLELTPEQRRQILEATGKEARQIEFTIEELEDRIAPAEIAFTKLVDRPTP